MKNLTKYTRHKLIKLAAKELDSSDLTMPSISDVHGKLRKPVKAIKSIITVNHDKVNRKVTKITGFEAIPEEDFKINCEILPPLDYRHCQEVELEVQLTGEEKENHNKLEKIENGAELVDLMTELLENNADEQSSVNQDFDLLKKNSGKVLDSHEESKENIEDNKENLNQNTRIEGYSEDELLDCIESDIEFDEKPEEDRKSKAILNTKEDLGRRNEMMDSIPERHKSRQAEKRKLLKEKLTDGMSRETWEGFKSWLGENKP